MDSNNKVRSSRRELRDGDVQSGLENYNRKIESRIKGLVDHSSEESLASESKFEELMQRLKKTAAAHKQDIASNSEVIEVVNRVNITDIDRNANEEVKLK